MRRQDIDKLLGGWAAGTLTDAERTALLQAALEDQALFDQLMAEEPLREAVADPVLRGRIARALDRPEPRRFGWFRRPWAWGLAGSLAATAVMMVALVRWNRSVRPEAKGASVQMAKTAAPRQPSPETMPQAPAAAERAVVEAKQKQSTGPSRVRTFAAREASARQQQRHAGAPAPPAHPFVPDIAEKRQAAAAPSISEPPALAPAAPVQVQREVERAAVGGAPGMASQPAPPPQYREPAPFMRQPAIAPGGARALFERDATRTSKVAAPGTRRTAATYVMAPPPANVLGLRYRILCRGAGGEWAEADPDRRFKPDDALRLEVSVNERAYYYVIARDAVLASGIGSQAETQSVSIPRGTTRVTLIASRVPLAAPLDAPRRGSESVVEKSGGAVYVAKTSFVPDSHVTAEIVLRYDQ